MASIEREYEIDSGIDYQTPLVYDITDASLAWCDCLTEEHCKIFIPIYLVEKEIAIGDFTKAMMKIATTAREFQLLTENHVDCCNKLSQIEDLVLKFIATNQSLYV